MIVVWSSRRIPQDLSRCRATAGRFELAATRASSATIHGKVSPGRRLHLAKVKSETSSWGDARDTRDVSQALREPGPVAVNPLQGFPRARIFQTGSLKPREVSVKL
jgi:hypothetical protein